MTIVVPVLLGALLSLGASAFFSSETLIGPGALLFTIGVFLSFSFYLSWAGLMVAIPLAFLAFRYGIAGWGSAVIGGIAVGGIIFSLFGLEWPVTLPAGAFFGAVFWVSLRLLSPKSFGD